MLPNHRLQAGIAGRYRTPLSSWYMFIHIQRIVGELPAAESRELPAACGLLHLLAGIQEGGPDKHEAKRQSRQLELPRLFGEQDGQGGDNGIIDGIIAYGK